MKVVLFCGGFGMRMRGYSESIPKPMVGIGYRPVLWHVMKYYAHFGHKDFILCLGWKANIIKDYFLKYDECVSNDFSISGGGRTIDLLSRDIEDWNITFCDTGTSATIGERLLSIREHIGDDRTFLANYTDGLTDLELPRLIEFHERHDSTATFLSVRPTQSFHKIETDESGKVHLVQAISEANVWMNGGFFVFSNEIFEQLRPGEDMVDHAFARLVDRGKCYSLKHDGFWGCMDTYKEMQQLQDMYDNGSTPWTVWGRSKTRMESQTNSNSVAAKPSDQARS
ncbi:sugar phosphate nucleotidyltransferase [Neorhodopirellula pilleata]|uniref:Glucose-1-phosphate cytidylyltransferase n=1 Tax=Neorhodopirellula pilleata TaxID=2714738 RepID=A0A5C6AE19_9BACT|nr:sugar phosphate nucleotidyltransferase [Neorhodopirellula pilleata]TWT96483.1 Glucose-1-phosphate cytidylyltransferase [Neorhodopirellula pilleata]